MENNIKLHIPVAVTYAALEGVLQKQLVGTFIPAPEAGTNTAPYARILAVGIAGSSADAHTVIVMVQLQILRTVLKRDKVEIYATATLGYNNDLQQLHVQKFTMTSRTSSIFYNKALEVLVNKVAYKQIIQKASVNLKELIADELEKVNAQLVTGLVLKGIKLKGAVEEVVVLDVVPASDLLTLTLQLQGNLQVNISDIAHLLPDRLAQ